MAEITTNPTQKKRKGIARFSGKNLKVDLTPMVDLGFILISFFIFTSTLSELKAMEIINPNDSDITETDDICESCVLTILTDKNNKVWYYEGKEENAVYKETSFEAAALRKLIADKKKKVAQEVGEDKFVLIVKPLDHSNFKNLVDIIDESNINLVKRYYLAEPGPAEIERFK
jgi:biopolymer transport protein ExbD